MGVKEEKAALAILSQKGICSSGGQVPPGRRATPDFQLFAAIFVLSIVGASIGSVGSEFLMNSIGVDVKTNAGGVMIAHGDFPVKAQQAVFKDSIYDAPTLSAARISSMLHLRWDMDGASHGSKVFGYVWYNRTAIDFNIGDATLRIHDNELFYIPKAPGSVARLIGSSARDRRQLCDSAWLNRQLNVVGKNEHKRQLCGDRSESDSAVP